MMLVPLVRLAARSYLAADEELGWLEAPGDPVALAGDGVYLVPHGSTVPGLLEVADHPCRGRLRRPGLRLSAGDEVTVDAACGVRLARMPAAGRLALEIPIDVDEEDAKGIWALPGVGQRLAERIVEDRARRGPFGGLEGLLRVRGIGPATIERLRGLVVNHSIRRRVAHPRSDTRAAP